MLGAALAEGKKEVNTSAIPPTLSPAMLVWVTILGPGPAPRGPASVMSADILPDAQEPRDVRHARTAIVR